MTNRHNLPPTTLVVFGISGDLSNRYILPALAALEEAKLLPEDFKLVGLSRQNLKAADILDAKTKNLNQYLELVQMDMASGEDYKKLEGVLPESRQTIFYLSIPPAAVLPILKHLSAAGLNHGKTKLLLEKPFGYDLESARELSQQIKACFADKQVYRIDHYLAKEMAQNLSVFLGSNALIRDVWNSQFIESIDIIAAEKIGIENRKTFYEQTGALRDFVQSHLLQLAALTLMRPCASQDEFEEMPERRLEALKALKTADPAHAKRAQYKGYREEVDNPGSMMETFVSVELFSENPRWQGMPIRLTTGKNLDAKTTEIKVHFKKTDKSEANSLVLHIQPKEGVEIDLWAKKMGFEEDLRHLPLSFNYAQGSDHQPDAYEQVLLDAMRSRASLFASNAEVLETWRILDPIIKHWSMNESNLYIYSSGSSIEQVISQA